MLSWLIETEVFKLPQFHKHFNVSRNHKENIFDFNRTLFMKLFIVILLSIITSNGCLGQKKKGGHIVLKDGTEIYGKVKCFIAEDDFIKMNGKKYFFYELSSFETSSSSYVIIDSICYEKRLEGKICAYINYTLSKQKTYNSNPVFPGFETTKSALEYTYLKKGDSKLTFFSSQSLYDLIKDNEKALEEFQKYFKKINDKYPKEKDYHNMIKVLRVYDPNAILYE